VIIERIDRSNHVLDTYKVAEPSLYIGRAYDNDIVVHDPYANPYHAHIHFDSESGEFKLRDLGSENGITLHSNGKPKLGSGATTTLHSGEAFSIGKTRYRVIDVGQQVEATLKLSPWDSFYTGLGSPWVCAALVALVIAVQIFNTYISAPYTEKLYKSGFDSLYVILFAIGYSAIWGLIAKSQRHESRFILHVNLFLTVVTFSSIVKFFIPIIDFNWSALLLNGYSEKLLLWGTIYLAVYISCYQSSGLSKLKRIGVAATLPLILLLIDLTSVLNRADFSSYPDYDLTVVSKKFQWRPSVDSNQYLLDAGDIYRPPSQDALDRE